MVNTTAIPQIKRQTTDLANPPKKVALLTAGGLAPCLSSAVGALITEYASKHPSTEIICYVNGYKGLLLGESIEVTPGIRATAGALHLHGGSPIGNSRVKLTNYKDCLKRGLVKEGQDPQRVAADQLIKDGAQQCREPSPPRYATPWMWRHGARPRSSRFALQQSHAGCPAPQASTCCTRSAVTTPTRRLRIWLRSSAARATRSA